MVFDWEHADQGTQSFDGLDHIGDISELFDCLLWHPGNLQTEVGSGMASCSTGGTTSVDVVENGLPAKCGELGA